MVFLTSHVREDLRPSHNTDNEKKEAFIVTTQTTTSSNFDQTSTKLRFGTKIGRSIYLTFRKLNIISTGSSLHEHLSGGG